MKNKLGDYESFDQNWEDREESLYNHWCSGNPKNQIQLAFLNHYIVFSQLLEEYGFNGKSMLETGCGRGSLSSHFSDNGWNVTLLDYSNTILEIAKKIFFKNKHSATFIQGDVNNLPFADNTFDLLTNIGLLEHFENIEHILSEQLRVVKPGGWCLSYVVPERSENVQKYFSWINKILGYFKTENVNMDNKTEIFRSDNYSEKYIHALDQQQVETVVTFGMYPLPMISHSPEFPFSLNSPVIEKILVRIFLIVLSLRKILTGRNGWICSEKYGQAFLIAYKKSNN